MSEEIDLKGLVVTFNAMDKVTLTKELKEVSYNIFDERGYSSLDEAKHQIEKFKKEKKRYLQIKDTLSKSEINKLSPNIEKYLNLSNARINKVDVKKVYHYKLVVELWIEDYSNTHYFNDINSVISFLADLYVLELGTKFELITDEVETFDQINLKESD